MERILYVPFDQLSSNHGVMKKANKKTDVIVLVESQRMTTGRSWHKERLFFLISSARHFAKGLEDDGFQVRYLKAKTTVDGIKKAQEEFGKLQVFAAEPSSFRQMKMLKDFGAELFPNDFFLTGRDLFVSWAEKQKTYTMENFYRLQRKRLGILMEGDQPVSGKWNFDEENRLPPPKNYVWPEYLSHEPDEIDSQVLVELEHESSRCWATTRAGAHRQLEHFLENNFNQFGPLEDAVVSDNWAMHHSLLSPYLNNGLLHPEEVVAAVIKRYEEGGIPLNSCEGFIRQVIGWREYINGMYWFLGEDYKNQNSLNANRKLLPLFSDPAKTKMNCVGSVVRDMDQRAWTHHIPRLMILSNLALLTGTNPQEFLDWMRERFIDATEWVMVPNVIGMGVHADGGKLMTKPYASGGAYISRMTQYCKSCVYDPKKRTGDNACPFTTLYWDFLERHKDTFSSNHRMAQQLNGIKRLSDLPETKVRAQEVLAGLSDGKI